MRGAPLKQLSLVFPEPSETCRLDRSDAPVPKPGAVQVLSPVAAQSCREIDSWRENPMSYASASLPRNLFKTALLGGQRQIGLWSGLCSNIASEIVAGAGFDWIVIDTEHAPNEVPGLLSSYRQCPLGRRNRLCVAPGMTRC